MHRTTSTFLVSKALRLMEVLLLHNKILLGTLDILAAFWMVGMCLQHILYNFWHLPQSMSPARSGGI